MRSPVASDACSTDPALAGRFARAGRTRVEQRFTTERMVAETLAVYERLA